MATLNTLNIDSDKMCNMIETPISIKQSYKISYTSSASSTSFTSSTNSTSKYVNELKELCKFKCINEVDFQDRVDNIDIISNSKIITQSNSLKLIILPQGNVINLNELAKFNLKQLYLLIYILDFNRDMISNELYTEELTKIVKIITKLKK